MRAIRKPMSRWLGLIVCASGLLGCGSATITISVEREQLQERLDARFPAQREAFLSSVTLENPTVILRDGSDRIGVDLDIRDPDTAEPSAPGEIGEIWLRADSVMTEYWNKPEQTAASLVDGWYRTGDAGRLDDEGYLFMADRVKDMIVTGGENVYTIEVEAAISSHPAVTQVAVVGLPDEMWGERVHAVVVCDAGAVTEDELSAHARQTIAGFKVPKTWAFQTDPLPLSAAGKVLKRELRARFSG